MSEAQDKKEETAEVVEDPTEALRQQLSEREARILELEEQVKRVAADFENFRRRQQEEQKRRLVLMKEDLFKVLLPLSDNLERTLAAAKSGSSVEPLVKGVELIRRDLLKLFEENEIASIDTEGQTFDPAFHEAMMTEDRHDLPDQSIVQELQKGYTMGERVLRPSLVKVSRKPDEPAGTPEPVTAEQQQ